MAAAFQVFLPDARGHGRTRWDVADGFRADWLVDDLTAFVDALGLATFHLVGYSMGGMTALGFAARHPARLRTLVVAGITTAREPRASVVRRLMDPARIERDEPDWAADLARLDQTQGRVRGATWSSAVAADVASQPLLTPVELHGISAPTLVMCGDRDPHRAGRPGRRSRTHGPRRAAVRRARRRARPHQRPTGPVREAMLDFYRSTETVARARAGAIETAGEGPA